MEELKIARRKSGDNMGRIYGKDGNLMKCRICLKPWWENDRISHMEVVFCFDRLEREMGDELCRMQLSAHMVPGCDALDFQARDELGDVNVEVSCSEPYPYRYKHFFLKRALQGKVCVRYTVKPRPLLPTDRCAPYLDFRCEEGGATSGGCSFLAIFGEIEGELSISWDMSCMPAGSRGICAFGEGDFTMEGSLNRLRECYFAMGLVKSVTQGDFGIYWLTEPAFDIRAIAEYTRDLFARMQEFFHDKESNYRIFVRKDPYTHSGGSAMERSYMFGWNDTEPVSVESKQSILAHEMVHNWPHLCDEPFGITSWYSEGAAEYYSVVLPLRMGLIPVQTALEEIQKMTDDYYTNPTRHMENLEAARICWQDRRAQKLPYGRGVFFLANTDLKIRQATEGRRSVDDVVLSLLGQAGTGKVLGNESFLETVQEISGLDLTDDLETMRTGGHFAPLSGSFDGRFLVTEKEAQETQTGNTVTSYQWSIQS